MKAAVINQPGAAPVYADFAEPTVGRGRELVSLVAAGIHPIVRSLASGEHYGSQGGGPLIPGVDAVGRTEDARLVYTGFTEHPYGTFAERMSVPMTLPLPAGADPVQIAGGLNPGLSSWLPLRARLADGPLGTVLVLGATGVAGTIAVQNALAIGAEHVVAVGRNRAALERLEQLDQDQFDRDRVTSVALTGEPGDEQAIGAAVDDRRPSTVLDFVWGKPAELTFAALGRSGLAEDDQHCVYVEIGATAGATASLPAALLRSTAITIKGTGAGSAKISDIMAELPIYMAKIADGSVRVPVTPRPLRDVSSAWESVRSGERVVLTA